MIRLRRVLVLGLFLLFASQSAQAARERLAAKGLEFSISVRQPEQLAAFYSARGFPQSAIDRITATCFLTVGIRNGSGDVAWLVLALFSIGRFALGLYLGNSSTTSVYGA